MTKSETATSAIRRDFSLFRESMPVTEQWSYLDHAAVAPLPEPSRQAVAQLMEESVSGGDTRWPIWARRVEQIRGVAADMMNATPAEVAFVSNTTAGIGIVAEGMEFQRGDNVVTLANEFPSNQYPWMNLASHGVETRTVEVHEGVVDLQRVADACNDRTRLVSMSWVGYATGYRIDVKDAAKMVHDQGALFFLDAIQGLGVYPLDVRDADVDFLAADGHKWLLGPEGAGLLFVKHELLDELRPIMVGWNSVKKRKDYTHVEYDVREDAARYEGGSPNMIGIHGLGASLELLTEFGVTPHNSPVADRILEISDYAVQQLKSAGGHVLSPRQPGHCSGIVTVTGRDLDVDAFRHRCQEGGVAVSARGGGIRISPHCYNNQADIDQFVDLFREAITAS